MNDGPLREDTTTTTASEAPCDEATVGSSQGGVADSEAPSDEASGRGGKWKNSYALPLPSPLLALSLALLVGTSYSYLS